MAVQICIHMMNSFWIDVDGHQYDHLLSRTRKGVSLLQYLILQRGRVISGQRLIRELWTGRRGESPENALKTMVSRVRALLNEVSPGLGGCIVSGQGGYSWRPTPDVTVDAVEILTILDRLKGDVDAATRAELTERLLTLYTGDLFITGDWANGISQVSYLHCEYINAVLRYVE